MLAMITDTFNICREKTEPLPTESNYFLKRYSATFDSVSVWVPSQGQHRSSHSDQSSRNGKQ